MTGVDQIRHLGLAEAVGRAQAGAGHLAGPGQQVRIARIGDDLQGGEHRRGQVVVHQQQWDQGRHVNSWVIGSW
jgi:hypothetical protein